MTNRRFPRKDGKHSLPSGTRLPRNEKNAPRHETNTGILVRSKLEQRCADFLSDNSIEFQYEPLILLAGKQYRPDFFLSKHELFIEICGYRHMPFYVDRQEEKRRLYERHHLKVIFINARSAAEAVAALKDILEEKGITAEGKV